ARAPWGARPSHAARGAAPGSSPLCSPAGGARPPELPPGTAARSGWMCALQAGAPPAEARLWISVANPRVENRVERVDSEVDQHDDRDDHQVDALDDWIVTLVDRIEQEAAHARQAEDGLDDDRAADDLRELGAQQCHDRDDRVAQRVFHEDHALAEPLGPRR